MHNLEKASQEFELSADAIAAFVECCDGKVRSFEGHERRTHVRYVVALPSIVQPLDEDLQPVGNSFHAVTRDISVAGVALVHEQPINARLLRVQLTSLEGKEIELLLKVLRCSPLGAYHDIAGEFVTRPS